MSGGGRPLKILLDARKARDFGIGTYVTRLASGLAADPDVALVAIARRADAPLFPTSVRFVFSEAPHYSLTELASVRRDVEAVRPDVFHAPHYVVPFHPPRATVVTVHDLMHRTRPEHAAPHKRLYARWMLGRAVRHAARIVTVSEATRRDLVALHPSAAPKAAVIPNGVEERFFDVPAASRERVRTAHGLHGRFVLFLGNDKPHKNLEGLLSAFALFQRQRLPVRLVLAGGAAERLGERRALVARFGLVSAVHDAGFVPDEDVPALLAESEALLLPSFDEGFGLPVLEAQAAGSIAICSDRGGLKEAGGDAAVYVDPEKPITLADALHRVLADPALRSNLASRGQARARGFTWAAAVERTARLYREIAKPPDPLEKAGGNPPNRGAPGR